MFTVWQSLLNTVRILDGIGNALIGFTGNISGIVNNIIFQNTASLIFSQLYVTFKRSEISYLNFQQRKLKIKTEKLP